MKQNWKIAVAFMIVFLAGGAIGSVFTLRFARPPVQQGRPTAPENFGVQLMQRWVRSNQLDLTPAQRQKIRPIVADTAEDLRRLRRESQHSAELMIEHMQDEIAAILTPDQQNRFNDLIDAQRRRMRQFIQFQQRQAAEPQAPQAPPRP
jgi:Spy/CpxP family protein refolding chaperone